MWAVSAKDKLHIMSADLILGFRAIKTEAIGLRGQRPE